jgi:hypothetical protein
MRFVKLQQAALAKGEADRTMQVKSLPFVDEQRLPSRDGVRSDDGAIRSSKNKIRQIEQLAFTVRLGDQCYYSLDYLDLAVWGH